jgi:hypothetical protein
VGRNPKSIKFKTALDAQARQFNLADMNYFEVEGITAYRRFKVNISLNPIDISSPPSLSDTASQNDTVFLKILQSGKNATLYGYKDNVKNRLYIKENNVETPHELIYGVYENPNYANSVITNKAFQDQLIQLAQKYQTGTDKLIRQIQGAAYSEADLIQVAAEINGNAETLRISKSKGNPPVRFFAGAAFSSSTLTYSANGPYYGATPATSTSPKISIGIDAIANPDVGHLIFRAELSYALNTYNINALPNPIYNIAEPTVESIQLKQNVLFITPQLIYNIYNADLLKLFVNLGYSVNLTSYQATYISTVYQNGKPVGSTSKNGTPPPDLKDNYSSFQFKAGLLLYKRFEIYGAYSPGAQITNAISYTTNLTSYQVGLNYFFGRVAH